MAPEQVQSHRPIDARADVFSLGCVLFECLTGSAAFQAEHPMALLAKVVFAEPPLLREARPEAPGALEDLLSRMLAKDPDARPRHGGEVAEALTVLEARVSVRTGADATVALTRGERRTISVALIGPDPDSAKSGERERDHTLNQNEADLADALRKGAAAWGGRLEELRDGTVAVSIGGARLATDQAAQAARCALWLREHAGGRAVALATGRGEVTGGRAAAEAIDRAAKLLLSRLVEADKGAVEGAPPIALDEMTARLLDARFDVREGDKGMFLHGERVLAERARLLLNKPTACVGRDRELSTLTQMFAECVEEPLAQAALLIGPAGIGKSRIAQELLARLRAGGEPMAVWIGRGDSLRAGSALGLLGQALRSACGIRGDEPFLERREKLWTRVASRIAEGERRRVAEILGEMIGTPFPDDDSVLLRTARRSAQIMTDEMRRAWVDFLRAETAAQPVLLVLEDLHWGDGVTVRFVDAALRDLGDKPWMVLSPARPEVYEVFPKLWTGRRVQEIQVPQLGKRASERLARQVLGDDVGAETMERLIARAEGNAFYLEELIRATAEHRGEELPETVVAMVQSRLEALDDEDRLVLRAAAVFGGVFWLGGVTALLGGSKRAASVERCLLALVEREALVRQPESRFSGEAEFTFRHALLREGAYSMLTGEDRTLGHRLAGEWLEEAGERDPKLLAEHFHRGESGARASTYYLRAAEQALEGGDCETAIKLSAQGIMHGRDPLLIADLRAIDGEARFRIGDLQGALGAVKAALTVARQGSRTEGRAIHAGIISAIYLRDTDTLREPMDRLLHTEPEPDAIALLASALFSVIAACLFAAQRARAELCLRRLEQVTAGVMDHDPMALAWVELARAAWACHIERDFWGYLEHARAAAIQYERSGVGGYCLFAQVYIAASYWCVGLFDRAEEEFARTLAMVPETGTQATSAVLCRAMMLVDQRKLEEASALIAWVAQQAEAEGDQLLSLSARAVRAEIHLYKGDLDAADSDALALNEAAGTDPYTGMWYITLFACVHLAQGRAAEAAESAARAFAQSRACDMGYCIRHATLLLVRAEAFLALGDHHAARQAIREARDDLLRRAAKIPDEEPEVRRCFLENIPDHRRTLELARQWLGEGGTTAPPT
jgi:eukaryotic-like serine/threonine-protein kinase